MGVYCDEKPELVQKWNKGIGKTILCKLSQNQCLLVITVKYMSEVPMLIVIYPSERDVNISQNTDLVSNDYIHQVCSFTAYKLVKCKFNRLCQKAHITSMQIGPKWVQLKFYNLSSRLFFSP